MKGRESEMPAENVWETFFDAQGIVTTFFNQQKNITNVVDLGCGYGTFTIQAAKIASGTVYGLDIEPECIVLAQKRAIEAGVMNVQCEVRDFVTYGTGLPPESISHVMIYNLLHIQNPIDLLREAYRILEPGGTLSIIHWIQGITPRGPSLAIRPTSEQCKKWSMDAGFASAKDVDISSYATFHFGVIANK